MPHVIKPRKRIATLLVASAVGVLLAASSLWQPLAARWAEVAQASAVSFVSLAWAHDDEDDDEDADRRDGPPRANAGADRRVAVGDAVVLNASGSVSPRGKRLTYSWCFTK